MIKLISKNSFLNFIVIIIFILGIFEHTFYIVLSGLALKFFYFIILISILSLLKNQLRFKTLGKIDLIFLLFFLYLILISVVTKNLDEHLTSFFYLSIIMMAGRISLGNYNYLVKNAKYVNISLLMLLSLGLIFFFYVLFFSNLQDIQLGIKNAEERREITNSLVSVIWYDGFLPRFNGFYVDPNFWAYHLVFALYLVTTVNIYSKTAKGKKLLVGIIFISIFLAFSRGAFLTIILIFLIQLILKLIIKGIDKSTIRRSLLVIIGFIIIISITLVLINNLEFINANFVLERFSGDQLEENSRFDKWQKYMDDIIEYPINLTFGFGLSRRITYFNNLSSHNNYIYMIYNYGLCGLIIMFLLIFYIILLFIKKMRNVTNEQDFNLLCISFSFFLGLLFQALFIDVFFVIPFWGNLFYSYSILKSKK